MVNDKAKASNAVNIYATMNVDPSGKNNDVVQSEANQSEIQVGALAGVLFPGDKILERYVAGCRTSPKFRVELLHRIGNISLPQYHPERIYFMLGQPHSKESRS